MHGTSAHYPHCRDRGCTGCVPPLPPSAPEGPVHCLGTRSDAGCGHPVSWHTGPSTLAPDCDCCSWRRDHKRAQAQVEREPRRTPPPAGFPAEKWTMMNRRERRAAVRKGGRK